MTRTTLLIAISAAVIGCKPEAPQTDDTGESVDDTGEAVEDTGESVDDTGDAVDDTGEAVEDRPSPEAFADLQIEALADRIQLFTVSADSPIELIGEHGTHLTMGPHQLRTTSGEMASGDVDIGSASGGTKAQRPPEKLLSILRNLYGTNLDIAEAYACRNVFALPVGTGPKRREEIVKAYLAGGVDQEGAGAGQSTNADGTSSASASASAASQHAIPPNKEAIPTPEQIAAIDEETAALRKKLRDVRRKRSDLRAVVSKLGQTHGLAKGAKRALDESCLGDKDGAQAIHESVSSAVAGREDLKALTEAGKDLMTKLDEEKEARKNGGADNDDDGVVDLNDGAAGGGTDGANAEPLSIEEDMERRKKIMRTGEKDELTKVSVLLKEK